MRLALAFAVLALLLVLPSSMLRADDEVGEEYAPVFPEPIPFDPAEWETNEVPPGIADLRAIKGGRIVLPTHDWPPTLRTEGPDSRLAFLSNLHATIYETLLGFDAVDGRYVPNLATHWQRDDDGMTYRFRLDERARWADGRKVTADDVVATVEHLQNPDRKDPLVQRYWDEMIEYAKVLDEYTVEIKTRKPRWRSLVSIAAGMYVYPAAYIRMDGETYLSEWDWKLLPGTGPYEIRPEDVKQDRSITLRRRTDWWGAELPGNEGVANFDAIECKIVQRAEVTYQRFLAGEIDMYRVGRTERWLKELPGERPVLKGWIQRRRIRHKMPQGFGGFCFNLRRAPFDDRNVRLAFAHLYNREEIIEEQMYGQYEYTDSYFPGQPWARPNAERIRYDPEKARALLAASGWTKRDAEGFLVDESGKRFPVLTLRYAAPSFRRIFHVPERDLWAEAGIRMELVLLDYASLLKKVWEYDYELVYWAWTANLYPDPIQNFHSKYADPKQTNNVNGFKNVEADAIMEAYQTEDDPEKRKEMLQRLDQILFDSHIYALGWYAPFLRIAYWDRFGHPPEYQARSTRDWINVMLYWWHDRERWACTVRNQILGRPNYPDAPDHQYDDVEQRWWQDHDRPMPDDE